MADLREAQARLREAILGPPGELEGQRLGVYRRLVRATLRGVVRDVLPRTAAALGERLEVELDRFCRERGPKTHYLRDVALELVEHLAPSWRVDASLPPHLADLARLEALELRVAVAGDERPDARAELRLDAPAVFQEALGQASFEHAVHEGADPPDARPVWLLVYRDDAHALRALELTRAAAEILERLRAGTTLGAAIEQGARAAGVPVDDALLAGAARLLADLADRGALLGAPAPDCQ
ncbi:MAG: putative DNA-binding domain-containing protein [Polyangiaceae bacterium]|nr:putative DNA-binding domain-containing protein [Polyangiaceae bacterium]